MPVDARRGTISVGQTWNRPKVAATPVKQSLLFELQEHLSADLFGSATPVRLAADEVLFLAGDVKCGPNFPSFRNV
jgi:hypothetical protein